MERLFRLIPSVREGLRLAQMDWLRGAYVRRQKQADDVISPSTTKDVLNSQLGGIAGAVVGSGKVLGVQVVQNIAAALAQNPPSQSIYPATFTPEATLNWGKVGTLGLIGLGVGLVLDNGYSWWVGRRERRSAQIYEMDNVV